MTKQLQQTAAAAMADLGDADPVCCMRTMVDRALILMASAKGCDLREDLARELRRLEGAAARQSLSELAETALKEGPGV